MTGAQMEMPKYRCHKQVWALKVAAIEFAEDGTAKIAPADAGYGAFEVAGDFRTKFRGTDEDLGYYVLYSDGYASWSPSKAFEEGYTLIDKSQKD